MRREFSSKVRVEAFARAGGRCEVCRLVIRPGHGPHYDHAAPDAVGGEPTLENCQVLCKFCHGKKTAETDVPEIAKTKRIRNRHINAEPKRRGFRGSRKFDGSIKWRA